MARVAWLLVESDGAAQTRAPAPRLAQAAELVGRLGGRVGTAPVPGSTIVLDRSSGASRHTRGKRMTANSAALVAP